MKCVCKAWKAASLEYNGYTSLKVQRSTDLFNLCKSLPHVQALEIKNGPSYYRHPITAFSHLSSLTLRNETGQADNLLDLTLLPPSLRELCFSDFRFDPACSEHIKCVGLRQLTILATDNRCIEVQALLKYLPKLEVGNSRLLVLKVRLSNLSNSLFL